MGSRLDRLLCDPAPVLRGTLRASGVTRGADSALRPFGELLGYRAVKSSSSNSRKHCHRWDGLRRICSCHSLPGEGAGGGKLQRSRGSSGIGWELVRTSCLLLLSVPTAVFYEEMQGFPSMFVPYMGRSLCWAQKSISKPKQHLRHPPPPRPLVCLIIFQRRLLEGQVQGVAVLLGGSGQPTSGGRCQFLPLVQKQHGEGKPQTESAVRQKCGPRGIQGQLYVSG